MMPREEEVLFSAPDAGWECDLPTTLITYPDGSMDLHQQTGTDWDRRLARAVEILRERGYRLKTGRIEVLGPSGGYMSVERIP